MRRRWIYTLIIMAMIAPLMPMGGSLDYSHAEGADMDLNQLLSALDGPSEARHCVQCRAKSKKSRHAGGLERLPVTRSVPAPPPVTTSRSPNSPLPYAAAIQKAIRWGYTAGKAMCGRGVWRILIKAGLVRGNWNASGANAINMGPVLKRQGFIRDDSACNRPGVVRIYNGNRSGRRFRNRMAGDWAGHIEIFGLDRQYHSFFTSPWSISENMRRRYGYASRRPLQSCWIKP